MERLTSDDRVMLLGDESWPQEIGAVAILDGAPLLDTAGRVRLDVVRRAIGARLHPLPRFRQVLYAPPPGLGGPLWVDATGFDVADHVEVFPVEPPGDDTELLAAVERIRRRRLDPTRPLWEVWLLPGLAGGRVGLFVRVHHVVADGIAGLATLARLLDVTADAEVDPSSEWVPAPRPSRLALVGDAMRRRAAALRRAVAPLRHPLGLLRKLGGSWPTLRWMLTAKPGPATSLDRIVGTGRTMALLRTTLATTKAVAHANGAKVNDVLLAMTAAGIRTLLEKRGEPIDGLVLPIYVPHSLRLEGSADEGGNLVSQTVMPLPLDVADPAERLRDIAAGTAARKARANPTVGALLPLGILGKAVLSLIGKRRVNLTSADLPGPPMPLYLAGAEVLELFPLIPLIGNVSFGVGALSYAGQFNVLVVADADGFPDLDVFVTGAEQELRALLSELEERGVGSVARTAS